MHRGRCRRYLFDESPVVSSRRDGVSAREGVAGGFFDGHDLRRTYPGSVHAKRQLERLHQEPREPDIQKQETADLFIHRPEHDAGKQPDENAGRPIADLQEEAVEGAVQRLPHILQKEQILNIHGVF